MIIIQDEINKLDRRLQELRKTWVKASPAYKRLIERNADLLKQKRVLLVKQLAEEKKG